MIKLSRLASLCSCATCQLEFQVVNYINTFLEVLLIFGLNCSRAKVNFVCSKSKRGASFANFGNYICTLKNDFVVLDCIDS